MFAYVITCIGLVQAAGNSKCSLETVKVFFLFFFKKFEELALSKNRVKRASKSQKKQNPIKPTKIFEI